MDKKLKPCPFCGGEAYIESEGNVSRLFAKHSESCFFDNDGHMRGLQSQAGNAADMLAEEWNLRTFFDIPEGYVVVPKEPSKEMADEAWKYGDQVNHIPADPIYSYKAMLSVAPSPYAATPRTPATHVVPPLPHADLKSAVEAMERAKALQSFTGLTYSLGKELEIVFRALTDIAEKGVAPTGFVIAPEEPSIEMVMAGEAAYENQAFVRLEDMRAQKYPDEHTSELCARVAYRAMISTMKAGDAPVQAVQVTPQEAADAGIECGDTACHGCVSGEGSCMYQSTASAQDDRS